MNDTHALADSACEALSSLRFSPVKICLQAGDPVEKQQAVEVVQLVLDGDRLETTCFNDAQFSGAISELDDDVFSPRYIAGVIGDAHATFTHRRSP